MPVGVGSGGRVLAARRPLWVSDYSLLADITHQFADAGTAEGVKAMIAVPIIHDGELLGVLYGANRSETSSGTARRRPSNSWRRGWRRRRSSPNAPGTPRRSPRTRSGGGSRSSCTTPSVRCCSRSARVSGGSATEPGLDDEVRARLSAIEQQAGEAAAALRGSLRVLSAPPEQVALGVALREHCRAFQDRTGVDARMITLTELPPLPASRVTALADAAREALLNVEKHARAQSVVVSVFALRGRRRGHGLRRRGRPGRRLRPRRPGLGLAGRCPSGSAGVGGSLTVARQRRRRRHRPGLGARVSTRAGPGAGRRRPPDRAGRGTLALQNTSWLQVAGYARTGREAIAAVRRLRPDVVLLDLRLPDMLGPEAIQRAARRAPDLKIILFTAYPDHAALDAALAAGAHGVGQGHRAGRPRRRHPPGRGRRAGGHATPAPTASAGSAASCATTA